MAPLPRLRFVAAALDLECMGTRKAMVWCCGDGCDEVDEASTFVPPCRAEAQQWVVGEAAPRTAGPLPRRSPSPGELADGDMALE